VFENAICTQDGEDKMGEDPEDTEDTEDDVNADERAASGAATGDEEAIDIDEAKDPIPAQTKPSKPLPAAFGVKDKGGTDSVRNDASDEKESTEAREQQSTTDGPSDSNSTNTGVDASEGANNSGDPSGGQNSAQQNTHENAPPNPFKTKGDINSAWFRRLNMVEQDDSANAQEEEADARGADGQGAFEFSANEQDTTQVLSSVLEEDAVCLPDNNNNSTNESDSSVAPVNNNNSTNADESRVKPGGRDKSTKAAAKPRTESEPTPVPEPDEPDVVDTNDADVNMDADDVDESLGEGPEPVDTRVHAVTFTSRGGEEHIEDNTAMTATDYDHDTVDILDVHSGGLVSGDLEHAAKLWRLHRTKTESHATRLCEQLRLILEPQLASRLQGDYRSGKRISMRKVSAPSSLVVSYPY
jgi:midasin